MTKKQVENTDSTNTVLNMEAEPAKISTEVTTEAAENNALKSENSSETIVSETPKDTKPKKSTSVSQKKKNAGLEFLAQCIATFGIYICWKHRQIFYQM